MASSSAIPEITERRARRSHKKSKLGCRTCRIRKVKCDERRPLCRNCERHFIGLTACDFDDIVVRPAQQTVRSAVFRPGEEGQNSGQQEPSSLPQQDYGPPGGLKGRAAEPLGLSIRIRQPVASSLSDPFETHPPTSLPPASLDVLMRHYLTDFVYRVFPFYVRPSLAELWWRFLRHDELSFHAMLLLSCFDHSRLVEKSRSEDMTRTASALTSSNTLFHDLMQRCLSLLASRAGHPSAATTDHTIASVAGIVALEYGRQNVRGLSTHLAGLDRLIQLRGGPEVFEEQNSLVADTVFWIIMISKERLASASTDSILPHSQQALTERYDLPFLDLSGLSGVALDMRAAGIDEETITAMGAVQLVSAILFRNTTDGLQVDLSTLRALSRVITDLMDLGVRSDSTALSRIFRLAACLQVLAPVSGYFPDPTLLLHARVHDLKASLAAHDMAEIEDKAHLLVWPLAVGGVTAHSMAQRSWFVGYLVVVVNHLRIHSWDSFREHIIRFTPDDRYCNVSLNTLWDEISQKGVELAPVTP